MNVCIIGNGSFLKVKELMQKAYKNDYRLNFIEKNNDNIIDILIIDSVVNEKSLKKYINKLQDNSIVIANIDEQSVVDNIANESINVVSYGFNPKSSITISSNKTGNTDTFMICVQRDINEFSEQEFMINSTGFNESEILLIVSTLVIMGLSTEDIKELFLNQIA